jgi:UDP-glucose 4-epimerase
MRILVVGGNSSLAQCLRPMLATFAEVVTAGRKDCDLKLDLAGTVNIPSGFDSVINTAADMSNQIPVALASAEATNVLGLLELSHIEAILIKISRGVANLTASFRFNNTYLLSSSISDEVLH